MFKSKQLKKDYWVCFYCGKKNDLDKTHCIFCRKEKIQNEGIGSQIFHKTVLYRLLLFILTIFVIVALVTMFKLS